MEEPGILIRRYPDFDDEPGLVQIDIAISSGGFGLREMFYADADCLRKGGALLAAFPADGSVAKVRVFQCGAPGTQSSSFSLHAVLHGARREGALQVACDRGGEGLAVGHAAFSINVEIAAINRLGDLLREFAKLGHRDLLWTPTTGELSYEHRRDVLS